MEAGRKVIKEGLEKLHHQLNVSAMDNPFNQVLVMIDNMEGDEEDVINGMVDFVVKYLKMVMGVKKSADPQSVHGFEKMNEQSLCTKQNPMKRTKTCNAFSTIDLVDTSTKRLPILSRTLHLLKTGSRN